MEDKQNIINDILISLNSWSKLLWINHLTMYGQDWLIERCWFFNIMNYREADEWTIPSKDYGVRLHERGDERPFKAVTVASMIGVGKHDFCAPSSSSDLSEIVDFDEEYKISFLFSLSILYGKTKLVLIRHSNKSLLKLFG